MLPNSNSQLVLNQLLPLPLPLLLPVPLSLAATPPPGDTDTSSGISTGLVGVELLVEGL